ncbi:MAG TPA: aminotransferase class V-fold PLP-dependent enzyme [Dehalococcoidia bacterium]|jgi:L-cysteine/cystine lyase|nr:aminotransferase class V-fold PLP-dependent enzyme [Dehalococcoidia bacterium]
MTAERWSWMREQTPVMKQLTYLNCGWSGPLSYAVMNAMRERLTLELERGPTTREVQEDRVALTARIRECIAEMIGADAAEITITGNTTEGLNLVTNGLPIEPSDRVVTTSVEHASGIVPAYYLRERRGAEVAIAAIAADDSTGSIIESFAAAIGDNARLVILSEISYSTGQLLPLKQIVDLAHRAGAVVVVDGAQTAGQIPIDVRASGIDFYAIPSHKWLCGPDGLGALYVREELIPTLDPPKVGGRAAASWDFEGGLEPQRELITKYELTTTSGALVAGTIAAVEQYMESGPQAVFDRARELTRHAEQRFEGIDRVTVTSPRTDEARTGLFAFHTEGLPGSALSMYLQQEAGVVCRAVKDYDTVRLSLNVFNNEDDIEHTAAAVEQAVREGISDEILEAAAARAASMQA